MISLFLSSWYKESSSHRKVSSYNFRGKIGASALLTLAVFQLPLAQNSQYAKMTYFGVASPAPRRLTYFHSVSHPHLILRNEDKLRENFHLAVKYYVLNFFLFPSMYFLMLNSVFKSKYTNLLKVNLQIP